MLSIFFESQVVVWSWSWCISILKCVLVPNILSRSILNRIQSNIAVILWPVKSNISHSASCTSKSQVIVWAWAGCISVLKYVFVPNTLSNLSWTDCSHIHGSWRNIFTCAISFFLCLQNVDISDLGLKEKVQTLQRRVLSRSLCVPTIQETCFVLSLTARK